jgi:hypothetical protein
MTHSNKRRATRIGFYTQEILKPVFKERGLMEGKLVTQWARIVGPKLSRLTLPEKVSFPKGRKAEGTLHLKVTSSSALLIQYSQNLILDQVNTFFGYKALSKLRMTHGFMPPQEKMNPPSLPLSQKEKEWIENLLESVSDPELKTYLGKLGEAIC